MSLRMKETTRRAVGDGQSPPAVPRRRLVKVVAVGLTAGAIASTAVFGFVRAVGGDDDPSDTGQPATGTATVTRQDLVSRTDVDGTLGYSGKVSVVG